MAGTTSNPKVTLSLLPAPVVTAVAGRRDLIVGQLGASATATSGALNQNVQALTTAQIRTLFGANVDLTYRILEFLDGNDANSQLDVIGLDAHGSGTTAAGNVAFTGTATADGSYEVTVCDSRLFTVTVAVTSGDTATVVGAALEAALTALTNEPFTASNTTGTVTITSVDKGTIANLWGIRITGTVPGLTTSVTAFTGGTNNPSTTTLLDPIDGLRYTGIGWPAAWSADLATVTAELDTRFNSSNAIMDGVCFTAKTDTYANDLSAIGSETSQSLVMMGNKIESTTNSKGPSILTPADWVASFFQGLRAKRLTSGAAIGSDIVTTSGALDAVGGPELASLPYFNTDLVNAPVTLPSNLFSPTEQEALETAGFTTFGVNPAGNAIIMGPVVTAWTTDAAGNPNTSFHYLNFVDTGSVCRETFFNQLKAAYSQSRLTEGDLIPGRSMANAESIKAFLLKVYRSLSQQALTQAGSTAEGYFARNTTVSLDLASRTVTITSKLPIVTQLGEINYPLQLAFTTSE